jgi:hypothetical protein
MCSQRNGGSSDHQLIVDTSTDGYHWTYVETVSNLSIGVNASMVNWNGNLVLVNPENDSSGWLWVFTSPNGTTWTGEEYSPNVQVGAGPGIATFNGGVYLAYQIDGLDDGYYIASIDLNGDDSNKYN